MVTNVTGCLPITYIMDSLTNMYYIIIKRTAFLVSNCIKVSTKNVGIDYRFFMAARAVPIEYIYLLIPRNNYLLICNNKRRFKGFGGSQG